MPDAGSSVLLPLGLAVAGVATLGGIGLRLRSSYRETVVYGSVSPTMDWYKIAAAADSRRLRLHPQPPPLLPLQKLLVADGPNVPRLRWSDADTSVRSRTLIEAGIPFLLKGIPEFSGASERFGSAAVGRLLQQLDSVPQPFEAWITTHPLQWACKGHAATTRLVNLTFADAAALIKDASSTARNPKEQRQSAEHGRGELLRGVTVRTSLHAVLRLGVTQEPDWAFNFSQSPLGRLLLWAPATTIASMHRSSASTSVEEDKSSSSSSSSSSSWLWRWSSSGLQWATHHDSSLSNYLLQISGRKRVLLFPPAQAARLGVHHPNRRSMVPLQPSSSSFTATQSLEGWVGLLEQGDVLFIPPFTLHYTVTELEGVSMNHFFG